MNLKRMIRLSTGLLSIALTLPVQAEPAPVFQPVLDEIRQQLPDGMIMRLPATLPNVSDSLYPFIISDEKGLRVYLSTDPTCNQPDCTVGGIAAMLPEEFARWSRKLEDSTSINLPDGIQGHYFTIGQGDHADQYLLWQQDGTGFVIGADIRAISQPDLMQIAASMVSEPPIDRR